MGRGRMGLALLVGMFLAASSTTWAQQASGITGVVRDESGGVLPGVTVEAASPALIEKVRSAVSDSEGRYSIVDLRPGSYVVTFSLAGFSTVKREGIVLTAGFTASVNGDMKVGALEETITVTGATPLVDTANVRQQKVVSAELLQTLPSGSQALQNLVTLTPGMTGTPDVGGSSGLYRTNGPRASTYHGKAGVKVMYDGLNILASGGTGASNGYLPNQAFAEETTLETGGISAESAASGISMNVIPKAGGNTFTHGANTLLTTENLHANNLNQELRDRGVAFTSKVLHLYDVNLMAGGPIKRDRIWFFAANRYAGNKNTVGGQYFNATQGTPLFTPDLSRQQYRQEWVKSLGGRITWQVTEKDKLSIFADTQGFFNRGRGEFVAPESSGLAFNLSPQGLYQVSLNSVRSNKLLLEAGMSYAMNRWPFPSPGADFMRVSPNDISILEQSTNFRYNAKQTYNDIVDQFRVAERFAVSYVTGSHAFKIGVQMEQGINNQDQQVHGDVNYIFLRGVPNTVTQWATPYLVKNRMRDFGVYAQDQWAIRRLTINYGLRYDNFVAYVPAQSLAATRFVPERSFDKVDNVPNWKDFNPRVGASYDLFGNGRTALKFSVGRYLEQLGAGIANENNPVVRSVLSANRIWNDSNGNYVPDCDLTSLSGNGECGPINNLNFGRNNPNANQYDPDSASTRGISPPRSSISCARGFRSPRATTETGRATSARLTTRG
jgi:Carboxypeptidase regulatory-like domain